MAAPMNPLTMGALPPPPGVTPNFVDPPSARGAVVAVIIACLVISTLCIGLRVAAKASVRFGNAGWDDYTSVLAWLGLIVYSVLVFESNRHGNGVHMWDVHPLEVVQLAKVAHAAQVFYCIPIYITKLSILQQYFRIFVVSRTGATFYTIHALIWANLLFYIAIFFALIFACNPQEAIWNPMIPGKCIDQQDVFVITAVVNVFVNIIILILPLNCLRKLQMPIQRKLGIALIFATGVFATATSAVWLVKAVQYRSNPDFSYNAALVGQWTLAELAAGLVIGCMPTFPQFFRQSIPKASAGLRGYWSRARTSFVTTENSRRPLATKESWDSRDRAHDYVELDERGGNVVKKPVQARQAGDLGWSGKSDRGGGGDLERGGISKSIKIEQEYV